MYIIDEEAEKKEILKKYRKIFYYWKTNISNEDKRLIRKAFNIAVTAHKDMRRKSGEPYIYHPLEVAKIIVQEIGLGTTSVICALLHDVVEDTDYTLSDIEALFGNKISKIIDGLTKIDDIFDQANLSIQAENFKKILLTLSDDVRVILIKLADRLHNMRTLDSMPKDKQLKIASETIYLYAPLAHRLGLHAIKSELEDLSLKYTEPTVYENILQKLKQTEFERNKLIEEFIHPIKHELIQKGFKFSIYGRAKSIYSIWGKMKKIRNMLDKENEFKETEIKEEIEKDNSDEKPQKEKEKKKKANLEKQKYEETINELNAKLAEANDKFLRLYSEFDNYRKRTSKERIELSKTASEDLIVSLLTIIDDFERALKAIEPTEENKILREGVELIYNKMINILSQKGLKSMESIGKEFNPEIHEAIAQVPSENEENKGKIFDEVIKGYYLHEKVIRHAKVVVSN